MSVDIDCFLSFHGLFEGESDDSEHPGAVQVQGWKWGASYANRGIAGAKGGHGDLKNFQFWHYLDKASPNLLMHCEKGMTIPKATLFMRRQGGAAQRFVEIRFEKVRVMSVEIQSEAANKVPMETIVLAFNKVDYEYISQSSIGTKTGGAVGFKWFGEFLA